MRATLTTRLVVWVGVPTALVVGFVVWNASRRSFDRVAAQAEQLSQQLAQSAAAELETRLGAVHKIPEMIGQVLETGRFDTPDKVESFLRQVVEKNPEIYGSCIAFKPFALDPAIDGYAPYWYRGEGGLKFENLAKPDYRYTAWDWYLLPRDADRAMWSEPYFDDGGGNAIMITFSAPFRRAGQFLGIATIDIAMSQLMSSLKDMTIAGSGYVFIVSKKGRYLAFPNAAKVMQESIQDTDPVLAARMLAGQSGLLRRPEPWKNREAWIAFAPVQNGELSLAIVYPEDEALADARRLQNEQLAFGAVGLLGLLGAIIIVARSITKPIGRLARAAQLVAAGDLEQRLSGGAQTEEVRHLTTAFNKMTRDLQMRMQELRYTTTVKERFEGELQAARSIQMSLVPKKFPAFPERREIEIHALLRPARAIGGDLYDFYLLDGDWLCFLVGDVSGKGVPAALFMAVTKTLLKANSSRSRPMAEMVQDVNNELCAETDSGMFVSLLYGHLNMRSGELELTNAGHPAPYLLSARDHAIRALEGSRNVALGARAGLAYHTSRHRLAPGDTLFFFTDGVTEALDGTDHFYGTTRLEIVLRDVATMSVEKITRAAVHDARAFSGDREQSDDISVLAVRWLGPAGAPSLS